MMHVLYSARLPKAMLQFVQYTLLSLIEHVCTKIVPKRDNVPFGRTFIYSPGQSIRIVLTKLR
jgi:hypothetical protein